jgi:hypothetical protein
MLYYTYLVVYFSLYITINLIVKKYETLKLKSQLLDAWVDIQDSRTLLAFLVMGFPFVSHVVVNIRQV